MKETHRSASSPRQRFDRPPPHPQKATLTVGPLAAGARTEASVSPGALKTHICKPRKRVPLSALWNEGTENNRSRIDPSRCRSRSSFGNLRKLCGPCVTDTEPTEVKSIYKLWHDAFTEMVEAGVDPTPAADAMLTVAGLIVESISGTSAARLALLVGASFMERREQPTPEPEPLPSGGCPASIRGLSPRHILLMMRRPTGGTVRCPCRLFQFGPWR